MDAGCQLPVPSHDDVAAGVSPWPAVPESHALTRAATKRGRCWTVAPAAIAISLACAAHGADAPKELALQGKVIPGVSVTPILPMPTNAVYHVRRAETPPKIDGVADEWKDVPAMDVGGPGGGSGAPASAAKSWDGPRDLSGSLRMMWDADALYFCAQVVDDVHSAPNGIVKFRINDSCQFAFDAYMNGPRAKYDVDEAVYLVCDSPKGPKAVSYRTPGSEARKESVLTGTVVKVSVAPDGARIYEWKMDWGTIEPVAPFLLGACGFSWALNDNDGRVTDVSLGWSGGLISREDASQFGRIVFDGAVGQQPGVVGLRPEFGVPAEGPGAWLNVAGVPAAGTARLIVRSPDARRVDAAIAVYRVEDGLLAGRGSLTADVAAGACVAFAWDVSSLPPDRYEVAYEVPAIRAGPSRRLDFVLEDPGVRLTARGELMVYVAKEDRRLAEGEFYLLGKYGVMVRQTDVKKGGPLQFILFDQPRKRRQVAEDLAGLKAMLAELPAGATVDFYDTCTEPLAGTANEAVLRDVRDYIDAKGQAGVDYVMCTCLGGINKRPWQRAAAPSAAPAPAGK